MDVVIRKYNQADRDDVVRCLEGLFDYLTPLDPLKRMRRLPPWGKLYTTSLLHKIKKHTGIIFVAEINTEIVGVIARIILKQTKLDLLEVKPTKSGRILELFVDENFRGKRIGKRLMNTMEDYFRNAGCDFARIEVFEPNTSAHRFYEALGYDDRAVDLVKSLS